MAQQVELQRLLDLCDEIRVLRRRIMDSALDAEVVARLKRRSKTKWKRLATDLASQPFHGSLRALLVGLDAQHFVLIATLLRRYLRAQAPCVEGRALLASIFDSSFELLSGFELLLPEAPLRANGIIILEDDDETDDAGEEALLDARFRLSDTAVDAFLEELGFKSGRKPGRRLRAYASQEEYLIDLKILHNLYRARAKRLFAADTWWRLRGQAEDRGQKAVDRQILRVLRQIDRRLERSPASLRFPVRQFQLEHGLALDETLVVMHLLFLEMLEGNPYADVVSLIQLVSSSEEDLFAKRELFAPHGKLRSLEIVELDQMLEGRELTSECHLGNWVMDRILGTRGGERPIDADEKLEFHLYLKKLTSSNFLQDL
ncbi:MAG: hypothetical protein H6832_13865 [Planctomycetes bacterium]|nr:hypothetical protein [Planctomycetota bacterium]MCB9891258.1 hypothetical protein [Planctomycetota bacterium]MCB9919483.1 hypothetical protein [Planctomycetota bacterium]